MDPNNISLQRLQFFWIIEEILNKLRITYFVLHSIIILAKNNTSKSVLMTTLS